MCVRACVRASVRASEHACMRVCVRACACARVCAMNLYLCIICCPLVKQENGEVGEREERERKGDNMREIKIARVKKRE